MKYLTDDELDVLYWEIFDWGCSSRLREAQLGTSLWKALRELRIRRQWAARQEKRRKLI